MVNQESDKDSCPEEHRDEGSYYVSDEDAYPERAQRVDGTFRPCRKGPLLESDEDSYPACPEHLGEEALPPRDLSSFPMKVCPS